MGITKFVLKRPVTAILAILCLIVFGYQSITGMDLELSPDMDMSMMIVVTQYSGASPEDVSELITKPIEDSVSTLSGLKSITSNSSEGSSMIMLEYDYGTDMDEAYDDLKKKVDMVANRDLPSDVDTPTIMEMNSNSGSDIMMVIENTKKDNLYDYVNDDIVPEFEKLSNAADVSLMGGSSEYIKIELIEEKMKQYGVTMSSISQDIANANVSSPAGTIDVGSQELSLTTKMKYDTEELLGEIPLSTSGKNIVTLQDVANIYTTSDAGDSIARYNGNDTISIAITKQQSSTAMALSSQVKSTIESLQRQDSDLKITIVNDSADSIRESLLSVAETLVMAIVISMIIIWLFFGDLKASLIVGSSIPVSVLSSLIVMGRMGMTLNIVTLSALTLGVGMMVDNSIVVLESCFRVSAKREGGLVEYMKDALEGTNIVGASVAASTATTCVVFIPLAMLNGMTGQLLGPLGWTIVFCMVASLISSIAVVPLCYMLYRPTEKTKAPLSRPVADLQDAYRSVMRVILPKRKTVMLVSVALLIFSIFLGKQLKTELMASDDQGQVSISIETRPGLKTARTDEIAKQVEAIISQHEDVESYMTRGGGTGAMSGGDVSITAYLKDDRKMSTKEVANEWKQELQDIPDCNISVDVSGSMSMMSSFGNSYEVILKGADYDEVKEVTNKIVTELSERPEVAQVHSNIENSSPVVAVTVDAVKAKAYGVSASAVGSTLRNLVSGIEATDLDIDGESVTVKVAYPENTYDTLDQIKGVLLSTSNGGSVLLTDVADVAFEDSPATIRREDKEYKVTITAQYTALANESTEATLNAEVLTPNLTETVSRGINSMNQSMNEEFSALFGAIATAIFLIFVVMAAQFESPKFSLMVMITIPFSLIGSFGLLWLTDCAISMMSLVGFLMLVGTVVNAGILYVDTVNQYRATMDRDTALIEAGATRLRPILMTTLTTVVSMIPMAMALGNSGEMTRGLAIVNIGGLTASTLLSLLMLPVFYSIMSQSPEQEAKREEAKLEKARKKMMKRTAREEAKKQAKEKTENEENKDK
ncbi:efflux RND transporter permease subunit [Brotaphodocola catenula]|uniref:Efflux RND transporter permease subunit n=1 Tax=Brotaphodocola catenula TaxID=2885361 RepID=A0AAE3ANY2_9FIRM|nr:efflux RND transporter permease subunit [Brotaphodocola catenula]MCC2163900.1 efflux RND transporter permease subunit [Brotaphodocola catenula]